jgi:hypothetical protein
MLAGEQGQLTPFYRGLIFVQNTIINIWWKLGLYMHTQNLNTIYSPRADNSERSFFW